MALPFIEVSHLASATSFYSSVLQPLGVRCIAADREQASLAGIITYGFPRGNHGKLVPLLQIRETGSPLEPLKLSKIVLSAPSRDAVSDFHSCGLSANPWLLVQGVASGVTLGHRSGVSRASIRDLDGNMIDAICTSPSSSSYHAASSVVPRSHAQDNCIPHVVEWGLMHDTTISRTRSRALSRPASPPASPHSQNSLRSKPQSQFQPPTPSRLNVSTPPHSSPEGGSAAGAAMSQHASDPDAPVNPRQSSTSAGLSTANVITALLGVAAGAAAGAALTYSMVNKEKERKPRYDPDPTPNLPRRSTYPSETLPDPQPQHDGSGPMYPSYPPKALAYRSKSQYSAQSPALIKDQPNNYLPQQISYPGFEYGLERSAHPEDSIPRRLPYSGNGDYVPRSLFHGEPGQEGDELVYRDRRRSQVPLLTERAHDERPDRSIAGSQARSQGRSAARNPPRSTARSTTRSTTRSMGNGDGDGKSMYSKFPDDDQSIARRSRRSSRHPSSRAGTGRSRSEAPTRRDPPALEDSGRSHAGSRHTALPKASYTRSRSHRSSYDAESDSYPPVRSRRSSMAAQHPPPPAVETEIEPRSRGGSRPPRSRRPDNPFAASHVSRAHSYVSARHVPLPMSGVGSSHADWDDDMESIAPSDSISCVGSRTSRRSRRSQKAR